ncbi:MAG: phage terminase large subunit family protein [Candidatus Kuenenia sp.]|nr:phage terminase large subunit family protein [Candidatus Kuenenia hertensis]
MTTKEKAYEVYKTGFSLGIRPAPRLTVSEWADSFRTLPRRSSAEPGKWRTSRTPYLREIMDSLSARSPIEQVKFVKATQIGGTEAGCNWFGYIAHLCPSPFMLVLPTLDLAEKHSKQKITPTIEETEELKTRIGESKSRNSSNTTLIKTFPGGMLVVSGANSESSFRNVSIRYLHLSDIDGYPSDVDNQGDPCGLAKNRTDAYGNRKIYIESTPTIRGISRIEQEYEDSDQRKYYVPCPHCHEKQVLMWSGIIFEYDKKDYKLLNDAKYSCFNCGSLIDEYYKTYMLENGEWIPGNPGHPYRGYHLSSLYSPIGWLSWNDIVREFLKAKKNNDSTLLKKWTNTRLAETWEDEGESLSDNALFNRREKYGPEVPEQVVILTAGVDIQDDRIEVGVEGWGLAEESWGIEYKVIYGDVTKQEVWRHLDVFLSKNYRHATGYTWQISSIAIDSGDNTKHVYEFVRPRQARNIWATKGSNTHGLPIISKPSKNIPGIYLYHVGTDTAKNLIFGRLKISEQGAGYIHFPFEFDDEYFKQLTAEKKISKIRKGFRFHEWVKTRNRNEALDIKVLNIAALHIAQSRHYPNYTVSQMLDKLSNDNESKRKEVEDHIPMPQNRPRRRLVSKVDIY